MRQSAAQAHTGHNFNIQTRLPDTRDTFDDEVEGFLYTLRPVLYDNLFGWLRVASMVICSWRCPLAAWSCAAGVSSTRAAGSPCTSSQSRRVQRSSHMSSSTVRTMRGLDRGETCIVVLYAACWLCQHPCICSLVFAVSPRWPSSEVATAAKLIDKQ